MRYFDKETVQDADRTAIVPFIQSIGEQVFRDGNEYRWKRHDSVTIKGNIWFQHSQNTGGGAISFCMHFFGWTFPDTVRALTGRGAPAAQPEPFHKPKDRKVLDIPIKSPDYGAVWEYLTERRKLSPAVVERYIRQGDIFQEDTPKGYHNAVFIGRDRDGIPRSATKRGTGPARYRRDCCGSDKHFGFGKVGTDGRLVCFEAAIDLMSFETMFPSTTETGMIACGGISDLAIMQYLHDYECSEVFLALDSDEAGTKACDRFMKSIPPKYKVGRLIPRLHDWNDILVSGDISNPYTLFYR